MAGYLQAPGVPISMSQINSVFDGRGNNLNAYRGTQWYTAAGGSGTFPSTPISFNDFYLKGPNPAGFTTVSLATVPANSFAYYTTSTSINIYLYFNPNGTWSVLDDIGEINFGSWGTPTTPGGGSAYWIRFTLTAATPFGTENPFALPGWNRLDGPQYCSTNVSAFDTNAQSATWTIQIATDSGGSNIIATATGIRIVAVPGIPP
jgi:hypothetical protein